MSELEKALHGEEYNSRDTEVVQFQAKVKNLCHEFNALMPDDTKRNKILAELVTGYNPYVFIESDFKCVFGKNIHLNGTL